MSGSLQPDANGHWWVATGPDDDDPWCRGCHQPMTHGPARLAPCSKPHLEVPPMASDDLQVPPEVRREVRRASIKAAGEVIAEAVAESMTDALADALARNLTRRGIEGPWLVHPDGEWVRIDPESVVGEHDRFRQHSVKLNSVMWALWQAWHPELAAEDHCDVDVDGVLDDTLNAVIAVRGERAAIISHALRSCQLFDGPGSCADYDEAAAVVAALGFPLDGYGAAADD